MTAQQLKNSILQMAVQGKLVPQDPNDEPASVLLERIRAEKERLIKEKKIKREKNSSVIFKGADNTPYEKIGDEVRSLADLRCCGHSTPKSQRQFPRNPQEVDTTRGSPGQAGTARPV